MCGVSRLGRVTLVLSPLVLCQDLRAGLNLLFLYWIEADYYYWQPRQADDKRQARAETGGDELRTNYSVRPPRDCEDRDCRLRSMLHNLPCV